MTKRKEPDRPLETVGVIDIGTNSVRAVVAEVFPGGRVNILERASLPVRLGQDTFVQHQLSRRAMNEAIVVLRRYRELLDSYRVDHIRAVATSAVREAANADAFVDRIFVSAGLDVEIIEPGEEIRLTVSAVRDRLGAKGLGKGHALVADVGGGSALLALLHGGETISAGSYALGSIRLQESLDTAGETPQRAAAMLRHQIGSVVSTVGKLLPLKKVRTLIALGGDARFAARHVGRSGRQEGVQEIKAPDFEAFVAECEPFNPEELARKYKLDFSTAETVVPALLVYQAVLHATAAGKLAVPDVTMRDGLILDLARGATGQTDTEEASSTVRAALMTAEKFHGDLQHAKHVAKLSLRLFDELQNVHRLAPRYRLLLHIAGLLHEVGGFVDGRSHHKHSYYLIANTELFGLRADEREIVANVARYHRRSMPKASHLPYMSLPREQRVIVSKLAALLRIADALERGHGQQVSDVRIEHGEDEVVLHVKGVTDLALERHALENKADLFEDVFGLRVRLEEM
ncbi:MAG: Ppx/GppA family phosphatase [Phycisphaerae bacterium]|nr:Ppx/GppA family phosphatase [Phycisphaerae bacterium]